MHVGMGGLSGSGLEVPGHEGEGSRPPKCPLHHTWGPVDEEVAGSEAGSGRVLGSDWGCL